MDLASLLSGKRATLAHVEESEQHIVAEFYEEDDQPTELYPGLYIGSIKCARKGKELLETHGIQHIITVCTEDKPQPYVDVQYHHYPIQDTQIAELSDILQDTHKCIDEILADNQKVLVHCMAGISRSGSVCISYIMKKTSRPFLDVWRECKQKRSVIHPNEAFKVQLIDLEKTFGL